MAALATAVAILALVAACDANGRGGSGASGGGEPTSSTTSVGGVDVDPNKPCGTPDVPTCEVGARCSAGSNACGEAQLGMVCQTLDTNCEPLAVPVCAVHGSCGVGAVQFLACSCDGKVVSSGCAQQVSADPARCSDGTFECGTEECRNYVEVCILSEASGAAPHCEGARDRGCSDFGVSGCDCLRVDDGQRCERDEAGATFIDLEPSAAAKPE